MPRRIGNRCVLALTDDNRLVHAQTHNLKAEKTPVRRVTSVNNVEPLSGCRASAQGLKCVKTRRARRFSLPGEAKAVQVRRGPKRGAPLARRDGAYTSLRLQSG
jgi:hypothetical protein